MIDGNLIRAEFARYLHEHTHTRWGLDAALMHVGRICYDQGIKDEKERKNMEHGCSIGDGLSECQRRLFDVLLGDDGQAWNEAERYLERERPDLYAALREGK